MRRERRLAFFYHTEEEYLQSTLTWRGQLFLGRAYAVTFLSQFSRKFWLERDNGKGHEKDLCSFACEGTHGTSLTENKSSMGGLRLLRYSEPDILICSQRTTTTFCPFKSVLATIEARRPRRWPRASTMIA